MLSEKSKFPKVITCMIASQWQNYRHGEQFSGCHGLGMVGIGRGVLCVQWTWGVGCNL